MKKILAIMGSPHKGKGYQIIQKIESRLKSFGEIDFNYVFLSDINFGLCKGCFTCFSKGERFCPINDDKDIIERQITDSDGVILVSPGYAWNVSWLMKNFIDRFAYTLHRPKFFNQSLMLVVNGGSGIDRVFKSLSLTLGGANIVYKLGIMTPPFKPTSSYEEKIERDINKAVEKFYKEITTPKKKSVSLLNLIWFRMFKSLAEVAKKELPADFEYFKDKQDYFIEAKVNMVKKIVSVFVGKLVVMFTKSRFEFESEKIGNTVRGG